MLKRTVIYLRPKLHRAIKGKAVQMGVSISHLVSEALQLFLREDDIDLNAIKDRAHEPTRSFKDIRKDLGF